MIDIIKVAGESDITLIAGLAHEIWNEHYVPIIGQAQVDYMLARFQNHTAIDEQISGGYDYYLVRSDGEAAGYFALVPKKETASMMLSKIYVRAPMRGKGLGKSVIDFAESYARSAGLCVIWLTVNRNNADSIAFYERMGFSKAGLLRQDIGNGFVMDDYKMTKTL